MLPATIPGAATSRQPSLPNGRWQQFAAWLVYRRVRITLAVFTALVAKNAVEGIEPHGLFAYRDPIAVTGCMLIFAGLAIRSWSAGILRKNRELTTTGPYAIVRNPLYVGSLLIMCGFCTMISDLGIMFVILGPIAALYLVQVLHEERHLAQLFEGQWEDYARVVPRFLPRSIPKAAFGAWDSRQWLGSREYNALGAALLGLLVVELWRLS